MCVGVKDRQLVRIFFKAGRTVDPIDLPFEVAQCARKIAKAALRVVRGLARADPRCAAAKRAVAAQMDAVGRDVAHAQRLHVRLQDRARQVVFTFSTAPIDEEARFSGMGIVMQSLVGFDRQMLWTMFRG